MILDQLQNVLTSSNLDRVLEFEGVVLRGAPHQAQHQSFQGARQSTLKGRHQVLTGEHINGEAQDSPAAWLKVTE